jgi:hypothetical protein
MTTTNATARRPEDDEALLPWLAAGTLGRDDARRIERALANDPELRRQYQLAREELGETIRLNEMLGGPSAHAMQRLMAAIEIDDPTARASPIFPDIGAWISDRLARLSPRTLAWAATAAVSAIVLQAGLIAGLYVATAHSGGKHFETASYEQRDGSTRSFGLGSYVLVRFTPEATANDITNFLDAHKAAVVEGPRPNGLFRLRVAETSLSKEEIAVIVARMQADKKIQSFVAIVQ